MQLKRNIKFFVVLVASTYSAWVLAQAQPQPNGAALGSTTPPGSVSATRTTTNTTPTATTGGGAAGVDETAPSEVTTMDPMDPNRDARAESEAAANNPRSRRARGPASGTVAPDTTAPQTVPNTTY